MLEHARSKFMKGLLMLSLVFNAVFISFILLFWQTTWLDIPALGVVLKKSCQGDLAQSLSDVAGGQGRATIEKVVTYICDPYSVPGINARPFSN